MELTRRSFTRGVASALTGLIGPLAPHAGAQPYGLPIGLQLYTVGNDLQKDFEGTMKAIAQIGYRQIEGNLNAGGKKPKEIANVAKSLGLGWRSIHTSLPELQGGIDVFRLFAHERDVEDVLVFDQHAAVPIQQHPPRRRQRQLARVIVVRHLGVLVVLRDLEHPEPDRQRREGGRDDVLQPTQP